MAHGSVTSASELPCGTMLGRAYIRVRQASGEAESPGGEPWTMARWSMYTVRVYLCRSVLDDRWGGEGRGCDEWQSGGPTGHGAGASGVGRGQGPGSESCEERTGDVGYCLYILSRVDLRPTPVRAMCRGVPSQREPPQRPSRHLS